MQTFMYFQDLDDSTLAWEDGKRQGLRSYQCNILSASKILEI